MGCKFFLYHEVQLPLAGGSSGVTTGAGLGAKRESLDKIAQRGL